MTTKLTLTIDDTVIDSAKKYAKQKGRSLSDIVENYLKAISTAEDAGAELSPAVAKLMGAAKLPDDFDYKQELAKALTSKHG